MMRWLAILVGAVLTSCATTRPVPEQGDVPPGKSEVELEPEKPKELPQAVSPKEFPRIPPPDASAAEVPAGYRVEVVVADLVYPTSVELDEAGNLFVAEAGYAYGDLVAPARVHRITPSGEISLVADQLSGPVNDLLWHQGRLYVSHRGKISVVERPMEVKDLVTDLPSFGDHQNNALAAGPDGKLYFGQGTATNSGVVGLDNIYPYLWAAFYPDVHDIPARDLELEGVGYTTPDALMVLANTGELVTMLQAAEKLVSRAEPLLIETGAFQPFGRSASRVKGEVKANGTILRMNPDGSGLEVFAWGLRNPFGLAFAADGSLYTTDLGFDERGSRPIANAPDVIWKVEQGAFYGFPDFAAGVPVTDPQYVSSRGEKPKRLLKNAPPVPAPTLLRPTHMSPAKFDFSRSPRFGHVGEMFVAELGWAGPVTGEGEPSGRHVARVDLSSGKVTPFFRTRPPTKPKSDGPTVATAGPRMPVEAKFSPDGETLFVVDFGAFAPLPAAAGPAVRPFPGTGVIWRVTRDGTTPAGPPPNLSILAAKRGAR